MNTKNLSWENHCCICGKELKEGDCCAMRDNRRQKSACTQDCITAYIKQYITQPLIPEEKKGKNGLYPKDDVKKAFAKFCKEKEEKEEKENTDE